MSKTRTAFEHYITRKYEVEIPLHVFAISPEGEYLHSVRVTRTPYSFMSVQDLFLLWQAAQKAV